MRSWLLIGLLVAVNATSNELDFLTKFKEFAAKFTKEYHNVEEMLHRLKIFHTNLGHLEKAQKRDPNAKYTHLSPLMDMSKEEFDKRNNLKVPKTRTARPLAAKLETTGLPTSFDWREKGAVNAIKDQAQCGSCWAFGTVQNIEGVRVVQGGKPLTSYSEQMFVSCDPNDNGCGGGLPDRAFSYLIDDKIGMELEADYPYTSQDGDVAECQQSEYQQHMHINSYVDIDQDEDQIAAALMKYGPLSIALNASPMQMYGGGISDPEDCDPSEIDHAVGVVGFGEEDGTKYWIIRNSWGTWWGEDGYYRLVRGTGACGMNTFVSTAIVNGQETKTKEIFV